MVDQESSLGEGERDPEVVRLDAARTRLRDRVREKEFEIYYVAVANPTWSWLEVAAHVGISVPRTRTKGGLTRQDYTHAIHRAMDSLCKRAGTHFPKRER